jgi:PAS domain S-box-containing protein
MLKRGRRNYQLEVKDNTIGVFVHQEGRIVFVNDKFTRIHNYSPEELIGKNDLLLVHPNDRDYVEKRNEKCLRNLFSTCRFRVRGLTKDGRSVYHDVNISSIEYQGKPAILGNIQDISYQIRKVNKWEESDQFASVLLDNSPTPITVINPDTTIRYVNPAFQELTGFAASYIIGIKTPYPWWIKETVQEHIKILKGRMSGGKDIYEEVFHKKNGREFCVEIHSTPVYINKRFRYYLSIWMDITERKSAEERLKQINEQLHNLSAYLEHIRENERAEIARELHDELGQIISVLKMDLFWLKKRISTEQKELIEKITDMSTLTDDTIVRIKRIYTELRPHVLDELGLVDAARAMFNEFKNKSGVKGEVNIEIKDGNIEREISTSVFKILQEALTNVYRHANASEINVDIKQNSNQIVLKVQDNGRGITQDQIFNARSFGLTGMKERAHLWGGNVSISGVNSKGTTVIATIPLSKGGENGKSHNS